ncbi:ABC transporter permease [Paenibacillus sp. JCM 10914]
MKREWLEMKAAKSMLISNLIMPFVLFGIFSFIVINAREGSKMEFMVNIIKIMNPILAASDGGSSQIMMAKLYFPIFLLVAAVVPLTFATSSIITEKITGTLESVILTPISTFQLLIGKILAFCVPSVLLTWICQISFLVFIMLPLKNADKELSLIWIITMICLVPLISIIAVGLAIVASSRVKTIPAAQQIGVLVVLPIIGLALSQIIFSGFMSKPVVYAAILFVSFAVTVVVVRLNVLLFHREKIISEWKH